MFRLLITHERKKTKGISRGVEEQHNTRIKSSRIPEINFGEKWGEGQLVS